MTIGEIRLVRKTRRPQRRVPARGSVSRSPGCHPRRRQRSRDRIDKPSDDLRRISRSRSRASGVPLSSTSGCQLAEDQSLVEPPALPDRHAADVSQSMSRPANAFRTTRSSAEQVRRTQASGRRRSPSRARSGALRRGGRPAPRRGDTLLLASISSTRRESASSRAPSTRASKRGEQGVHEALFVAEAGEQRQVGIGRRSRLPPARHDDAADEAEAPALRETEGLELDRGFEDRAQRGCRRRNRSCCWRRPDLAAAGQDVRGPGHRERGPRRRTAPARRSALRELAPALLLEQGPVTRPVLDPAALVERLNCSSVRRTARMDVNLSSWPERRRRSGRSPCPRSARSRGARPVARDDEAGNDEEAPEASRPPGPSVRAHVPANEPAEAGYERCQNDQRRPKVTCRGSMMLTGPAYEDPTRAEVPQRGADLRRPSLLVSSTCRRHEQGIALLDVYVPPLNTFWMSA